MSKLPFTTSTSITNELFEKIHCDIWGPYPVYSKIGYRYYACLIDDKSKFTWFIPLKFKSEFL